MQQTSYMGTGSCRLPESTSQRALECLAIAASFLCAHSFLGLLVSLFRELQTAHSAGQAAEASEQHMHVVATLPF